MTDIIKPIPRSNLHNYTDEDLQGLVKAWRAMELEKTIHEQLCKDLVDDVYKVLGYRSALEYIERYKD